MAFQMALEAETKETAKKALPDSACHLAVAASKIYCRLKEVYDMTEEE